MTAARLTLPNAQPVEHLIEGDGKTLDVVSLFQTIQGEGPFAGRPAVFVRLAGCNLSSGCTMCDTDYTTGRRMVPIDNLAKQVETLAKAGTVNRINLVVITGGEPFRQPIAPFMDELLDQGYQVQIETNGTLDPRLSKYFECLRPNDPEGEFHVVCSPKTPKLHNAMLPWIDVYKYVVRAGEIDPRDGLPTRTLGNTCGVARPHTKEVPVYVQPLDEQDPEKNKANALAAVNSCLKFGYRLSYQIHKDLDLP